MQAIAKLTVAQIWIIFGVLSVLTAALLWYALIKPREDEITKQASIVTTNKPEADALPVAIKDLAKANQEVAAAKVEWARYDKRYMPRIGTDDPWQDSLKLWDQQMFKLGPKIRDFITKDKTVQITGMNLQLPAPSSDPNVVSGLTLLPYELGTITVTGTFENILRHVERYNTFDRLIMVRDLTLSGNSPNLVGTYAITCYIFPQGDGKGKTIPIPQAPSGAGGGMGGGMGMMMGGKGGGMSGPPGGMGGGPAMAGGEGAMPGG
jgi:hypothetical protein